MIEQGGVRLPIIRGVEAICQTNTRTLQAIAKSFFKILSGPGVTPANSKKRPGLLPAAILFGNEAEILALRELEAL